MKRSHFFLYILLNILISAATTFAVLSLWDQMRKAEMPAPPEALVTQQVAGASVGDAAGELSGAPAAQEPAEQAPDPTANLPPLDVQVIQIQSVVGPGDLGSEVVLLRRLGEGNLPMPGWRLEGENGSAYVFPDQPELVLYKDGAVQLYSRSGENTATEVYWNRTTPAWRSGETIKLLDSQGNERAIYRVP